MTRFSIHDSPDPAPPENPDEVEAWHEFMAATGRCEGCGEWVPLDELVDNRHPVPLDDDDVDFCGPVYHPTLEKRPGCPHGTHPECYTDAQQPGDCQCFDEWEDAVAAGLPTRGLFNPDTPKLQWPDDWGSEEEPGDTDMEARGQTIMGLPEGISLDDYRRLVKSGAMPSPEPGNQRSYVSERSGLDYGPYPITGGNTGANSGSVGAAMQDHIGQLLRILGLGDHARPESPAAVMEHEIIPAVRALKEGSGYCAMCGSEHSAIGCPYRPGSLASGSP